MMQCVVASVRLSLVLMTQREGVAGLQTDTMHPGMLLNV